jgi:hypothetical protein
MGVAPRGAADAPPSGYGAVDPLDDPAPSASPPVPAGGSHRRVVGLGACALLALGALASYAPPPPHTYHYSADDALPPALVYRVEKLQVSGENADAPDEREVTYRPENSLASSHKAAFVVRPPHQALVDTVATLRNGGT